MRDLFALLLFVIPLGLLLYHWVLFPLLLWLVSRRRNQDAPEYVGGNWPSISIIVPVRNEEANLPRKLENSLKLDYPGELELLFASDASTDASDSILGAVKEPRFRWFRMGERSGKVTVVNRLAREAKGDLLFISDADILVEPGTLELMARWFADSKVGAVQADHSRYRQDGSPAEGVFDRWESLVRRFEGRLGVMAGPNGWGLMIRRQCYEPIPGNTINDDLELGIRVLKQGYHFLFEPRAIVRSGVEAEKVEFGRRVRFGRGNMQALAWNIDIYKPGTLTAAWALTSHKFLRTLIPFTLVWMPFGAALGLPRTFYLVFLILLAAAVVTTPLARHARGPLRKLMLPQYFILMNAAQLYGGLRYIFGFREPYWKRTPRVGDTGEGAR